MSNLNGYKLGRYEIIEPIGRGGMAHVYLAYQSSIGREVAVKVLPGHLMQDPMFLHRFNREVQVISHLEHPRILPVHDFGEQDGLPYIVMRYVAGGTLATLIRQNPGGMDLETANRIVRQVCEGLDFAHKNGIIHRDYKPANVLLDEDKNVYLADFGIAKVAEATMQLTGSGLIGTPAYLAPEMGQPGGTTPLIDIYAVGVTLFEMLAGHLPYTAKSPVELLMKHLEQPIPNLLSIRPDLPEDMQDVIERAMAKEPFDRFQKAPLLAEALQKVLTPTEVLRSTPQRALAFSPPAPAVHEPGTDQLTRTLLDPTFEQAIRPTDVEPSEGQVVDEMPSLEEIKASLERIFLLRKTMPYDMPPVDGSQGIPAPVPAPSDNGSPVCPNCGTQNRKRRKRCKSCGQDLPVQE